MTNEDTSRRSPRRTTVNFGTKRVTRRAPRNVAQRGVTRRLPRTFKPRKSSRKPPKRRKFRKYIPNSFNAPKNQQYNYKNYSPFRKVSWLHLLWHCANKFRVTATTRRVSQLLAPNHWLKKRLYAYDCLQLQQIAFYRKHNLFSLVFMLHPKILCK